MTARHVVIALVALLLGLQGGAALAYSDGEIVALELSGQLLAPAEMVAQVDADFAAIRQYDDYFSSIHVRTDWEPGVLIVRLTSGAWQLFLAGQYHGLDALNAQYGPVQVEILIQPWLVLTFSQAYNPELLGPIYAAADGVANVDPAFYSGDGDDITASALGSYTFKHGWYDCELGCVYAHYWDFMVTSGVVQLVSQHGNAFGACCLASGECLRLGRQECYGTFHGGPCAPSPCGATAVGGSEERASWGELKSKYR